VHGLILAGVSPSNTPSGYYWTFLFPMILLIVIGGVLYLLFWVLPHKVPGHDGLLLARATGRLRSGVPGPGAPAAASGFPAAAGGGTVKSPAEAAGAHAQHAADGDGDGDGDMAGFA
jgi:hypothetical protein